MHVKARSAMINDQVDGSRMVEKVQRVFRYRYSTSSTSRFETDVSPNSYNCGKYDVCTYECIHVCINAPACIYDVSMYVYVHTTMHIFLCMYVCMYLCMYVCMYVCM